MQESVYNIMPELWLRKVFPDVVKVISYLSEERVRTILTKEDLSLLPENITKIYKRNMISRYIIGFSIEINDELCYASFVKHCQLLPKKIEKGIQHIELRHEIVEMNHPNTDQNTYPQLIIFNTGEKLRFCKFEYIES